MMDLGKVKEALIAAREELPEYSSAPLGREPQAIRACRLVSEAIAELEKPAYDDVMSLMPSIFGSRRDAFDYMGTEPDYNKIASIIQQYAESYHAKKCAEQWISANERLPDPETVVLISTHDWVAIGKYKTMWNMGDGAFSDDGDCGISEQPTHWQPLPEAPHA